MDKRNYKIYAIDFDGTIVSNAWPHIGVPNCKLIERIKNIQTNGDKWILWTMRSGQYLEDAIECCHRHGLVPDAVNDNLPELIRDYGNNPRKIYADYYIDDHNLAVPEVMDSDSYEDAQDLLQLSYEIRRKISKLDTLIKGYKKVIKASESLQLDPKIIRENYFQLSEMRKTRKWLVANYACIWLFDSGNINKTFCNFEHQLSARDRLNFFHNLFVPIKHLSIGNFIAEIRANIHIVKDL